MGGKSSSSNSSSSSQSSTENNSNAENSGVTTADTILQGQTITYSSSFGPEVAQAFESLINLSEGAGNIVSGILDDLVGVANKSLDLVGTSGDRSLTAVAQHSAEQSTPGLSTVNSLLPVLMVASVGLVAYLIIRK